MKNLSDTQYDIIIIGGGIVGLTFAAAVATPTLRVAIIEEKTPEFSWSKDKFELRVSAINRASQQIFIRLQAWTNMQALRVSAFRDMEVWDAAGKGQIKFESITIAEPNLGHVIENQVMLQALREQLSDKAIDFICPALPQTLCEEKNKIILTLNDQRSLSARLIVGADGAQSWVRAQANIPLKQGSYGQHAMVTTVRTELPHQKTARQRFLKDGILAFLPLADPHHCSIVWSTTPEIAQDLSHLTNELFNAELTEAFAHQLGQVEKIDHIITFPLAMRHAQHYVKSRLALIGDAAHTIHPLAGQGVNLGLLDAACLAEVIQDTLKKNRDMGAFINLRRYERWRKGHNLLMLTAMDGFKYLFGNRADALVGIRSLGLNLTDRIQFVKDFFMQYAMGLKGDLPRLAQ